MSTPRDPDEQYADRLRDVLRAEGDQVVPGGDGLMRIRERLDERQARNRWMVPLAAAASVALVAGGVLGGLAIAGNDDDTSLIGPAASPTSTPPPPPPGVTPPPMGHVTPPAPGSRVTVPVYYLADTGTAIRLYREFHNVASTKGKLTTALQEMVEGPAVDEDYTTLWPKGTEVQNVIVSGPASPEPGVATVDFSAAVNSPFNGGTEGAKLTIQQLVWTTTAADNSIKGVRISVEGKHVDTLFGVDVSKTQKRDVSYEVLGAVWVLAPTQAQKVASPVKISGQATVFEGTVSIQIKKNGVVVKETHTQATAGGPVRGDWSVSIPLAPGTYEVLAYESSAKDGSAQSIDDKTFTVR